MHNNSTVKIKSQLPPVKMCHDRIYPGNSSDFTDCLYFSEASLVMPLLYTLAP